MGKNGLILTPPAVKNKLCRFANWDVVSRSKPVVLSSTAPVAFWYAEKALVARRTRVVPVSTIPAVVLRMFVDVP